MATTRHNPPFGKQSCGKRSRSALAALLLSTLIIAMGGCSIAPAPLKDPPHIVATPASGQLTVTSEPSKPIGDVLPIYVSVANGTDSPRAVVLQAALALIYLWDVGRNERVPDGTERVWRLAILFAGPLAEPVYYWYFIWGGDA